MESLQMDSLTGLFDQFVNRFGPATTCEERKTNVGICLRASWVLANGTKLLFDEGDSVSRGLGSYRTAYVTILHS